MLSSEEGLLDWFNKRFKFYEGFSKRELSWFKILTGLLLLRKLLTHINLNPIITKVQ